MEMKDSRSGSFLGTIPDTLSVVETSHGASKDGAHDTAHAGADGRALEIRKDEARCLGRCAVGPRH
jgi:hypothetical protein